LMARETGVKVCGLCHGHYGYRTIARIIGLDPDHITWQAPGLNHNIWLTHFYHDGEDAYPLIDEWIENKAQGYWQEMEASGATIPAQMSPSAVNQYKLYGLFPVGDTPRSGGWWYHTDLEARIRWYGGPMGGGDTPQGRDEVIEHKERRYQEMKQAAYEATARPIDMFGDQKTTEQHIPIVDALVNNNEYRAQVNVPNRGALPGLPDDVAIEVPAIVNVKGIQPLRVAPLPPKVMLERIYPVWLSMERTLEALKSGDKSMLLYGILDNHQTRTYDQAIELLEALLSMEPNEPMAYIEDVNDHYKWPGNW
jgi:alpha-galactosidase